MLAKLLNLNPFNQPAVELIKKRQKYTPINYIDIKIILDIPYFFIKDTKISWKKVLSFLCLCKIIIPFLFKILDF